MTDDLLCDFDEIDKTFLQFVNRLRAQFGTVQWTKQIEWYIRDAPPQPKPAPTILKRQRTYASSLFESEKKSEKPAGEAPPEPTNAPAMRYEIIDHERGLLIRKHCSRADDSVASNVPPEKSQGPKIGRLNDCEDSIVQSLREHGDQKGGKLAITSGYPYTGSFKATLASLVRQSIIQNSRKRGYFLPET